MADTVRSVGRLGWVQVDCADPIRLATFWGAMLGHELDVALGDPPQYLGLVPDRPGDVVVSFQRVPEAKALKNRLHFDVSVEDVDEAAARVVALGGSIPGERGLPRARVQLAACGRPRRKRVLPDLRVAGHDQHMTDRGQAGGDLVPGRARIR